MAKRYEGSDRERVMKLVMSQDETTIEEIGALIGRDKKRALSFVHCMRQSGFDIAVRKNYGKGSTYFYSVEDEIQEPLYIRIYEKMAIDIPREGWSTEELCQIFEIKKENLRHMILNIRKNICKVKTERINNVTYYTLDDGV